MGIALAHGADVVFDATLAKQVDRRSFASHARSAGAERITGVYFDVPIALAHERNRSRKRIVPEHALERMHRALHDNPPTLEDGFDAIIGPSQLQ